MKKDKVEKLAEKTLRWINSKKGKQRLLEAGQEAAKKTAELRKARQVDPKMLDKPMTI